MNVYSLLDLFRYNDDDVYIFDVGKEEYLYKGEIRDVPMEIGHIEVKNIEFTEYGVPLINV